MKKKYIAPTTSVLNVEVHQMICVSGQINKTQEVTDVNEIGSRQYQNYSIWDDEEDE